MRKITKKILADAHWVCFECGKKYGRNPNKGGVSTWHDDVCDVCGEKKTVTETRDFGYLREHTITVHEKVTDLL